MGTYKASRRKGFVLIEALIALLLVSVGLLAVSKLQVLSISGAGEAKARSRAMTVSQQKLEELRNIVLRGDFTGLPTVNNDPGPAVAGDTATYAMSWTATLDVALEQQLLQIRTVWTDRNGVAQQIDLNSVIAWDDPGERVKTAGSGALPQIISPTGDAIRGTGGYGNTTPPGTVTTNSDGTRIHVRGDNTTELLAANGNILLYLKPKGDVAQSFTTISGKVFFDDGESQIPDSNFVRLRLSSEGECIFKNAVADRLTQTSGSNAYHYFAYTCYVGAGWYGNVGVVVDESVTGAKAGPIVCVGDPQFNGGVSNSTLISAHPFGSATRSYRGFKTSGSTYLSTGMGAGTHYGTTATLTGPFAGRPLPSTYPAYYGVITAGSAGDYFDQHFLVTRLSGPSASCSSKMTGGTFLKNAGKYFCINPDNDPAANVCPDVWPNFAVGTGGSINFTLNVVRDGTGTGTVTEPALGMNCPTTPCSGSYASGSTVVFTASPVGGSEFTAWTGCSAVAGNVCSVTVSGTTTVTATFTPVAGGNSLTVTKNGSGSGTVTSGDSLINCGGTCSSTYASGATVTLTATPSGSVFTSWSGGGCSGTGTCTVTVSGATAVTATFTAPTTHVLTVTKAGTGSGTVLSSPAGITCGGTCMSSYAAGTSVTLTATATAGSSFTGWSGGSCSGAAITCTFTVGGNANVTATFGANPTCSTFPSGKVHANASTVTSSSAGTCSIQGSTKNYDCPLGLSAPAGSQITLTNQGAGPPAFSYQLSIFASCGSPTNVNFP